MLKNRALAVALITLVALLALAGCAAPAAPAVPTAAATAVATPLPTITPGQPVSPLPTPAADSPLPTPAASLGASGDYRPVAGQVCEELRGQVGEVLGKKPDTAVAKFEDVKTGQAGEGCAITVKGTGADFTNFFETAQELQAALEKAGWTEDPAYLADGPTGTAFGLRKGDMLALASVGWDPAEGVRCPTDFPISQCDIKPEQQIYTITVNVATAK